MIQAMGEGPRENGRAGLVSPLVLSALLLVSGVAPAPAAPAAEPWSFRDANDPVSPGLFGSGPW